MKRWFFRCMFICILLNSSIVNAKDISVLQYLFVIKKIYPEIKELSVFMSDKTYNEQKDNFSRGSAQLQIKVNIHKINSPVEIGKNIQLLKDNSILLIFNDEIFENNKNRVYLLSKCKDKKISIITSSIDYSDAGALLYLSLNEDGKVDIVLNLKHSQHLLDKFTPEFNEQLGIKEVIQ